MIETRPGRRQLTVGAVSPIFWLGLLAVAVPLLIFDLTEEVTIDGGNTWLWCFVTIVVSGVQLTRILSTGQPELYDFAFWLFTYVWMGAYPMMQLRLGRFPGTTPNIQFGYAEKAAIVILVGITAKAVGSWIASKQTLTASSTPSTISAGRTKFLVFLTFVFMALSISRTGISPYLASRETLFAARNGAFGDSALVAVMAGLGLALPLVSVVSMIAVRRQRKLEGSKPGFAIMLPLMIISLLGTTNIFSSARITFGTALIALGVAFGFFANASRRRFAFAGLLVAMVVVFPSADLFRYDNASTTDLDLRGLALKGDYDAFAQMINTVAYVEAEGTTSGDQALGVALFWVPRAFWADKPTDTGILLADWRGYAFTNLSEPVWGEAYINFGWIGLVLGMGVLGFALRRGDMRIARTFKAGQRLGPRDSILPFFMLIVFRGSLLQAAAGLAAILVVSWLTTGRTPAAIAEGDEVEGLRPGRASSRIRRV